MTERAEAFCSSHDERLRAIVWLGNHEGEETMVGKINIGRQAALHNDVGGTLAGTDRSGNRPGRS
eukprot:COSAG02_NODE_69_length_42323_cov_23.507850_32_plen_65_part_00